MILTQKAINIFFFFLIDHSVSFMSNLLGPCWKQKTCKSLQGCLLPSLFTPKCDFIVLSQVNEMSLTVNKFN